MKKTAYIILTAVLVFTMIVMTACSGGSLTADANNEKMMNITADKATEEHMVTIGSLKVDEGDEVTASADLEEGELKVELFGQAEEQSADELPELDGEAIVTAILKDNESMTATLPAGDYTARITPTKKTTGTALIIAEPAE